MLNNVNSNNNLNFQGAFRIKPQDLKAKNEIPALFTQGKQVFKNILEKDDCVIVLRDKYDKRVGKYITDNNLKEIEYYPEINTKSGLDDEKPDGLLELINNKSTKMLSDIKEITKAITEQKILPKKTKINKELQNISNSLRLNIERPKLLLNSKASTIIRDEDKKRTLEIIVPNTSTRYVYIKPDSYNQDSTRCIIDNKGNIAKIFETPDEMRKFSRVFNKLKQEQKNLLADK